jgi:Lrp/AsnC family leucine-responsive transcriptional regulator
MNHKRRPAKTGENAPLDAVDREILSLLVGNARISYRELGEQISLSSNAAADRVRRLRERGVIAGFRAIIDPAAAGRRLVALIDVRLADPTEAERFEALVGSLDEVTDAAHLTGRFDYQIRAACRDPADLDALIKALKARGGVIETDTRIVLRTVVRRSEPLPTADDLD